jgi:hypothetical protein
MVLLFSPLHVTSSRPVSREITMEMDLFLIALSSMGDVEA